MTDPITLRATDENGMLLIEDQLDGQETLGSIIARLREHLAGQEAVVQIGKSVLNIDPDGTVTYLPRKS